MDDPEELLQARPARQIDDVEQLRLCDREPRLADEAVRSERLVAFGDAS